MHRVNKRGAASNQVVKQSLSTKVMAGLKRGNSDMSFLREQPFIRGNSKINSPESGRESEYDIFAILR